MSRLPLRLRLTLAFALLMTIVLVATGLIVYRMFVNDLNGTINRSLSSRSEEVGALITQNGGESSAGLATALDRVTNEEDDFAQVLASDGRLLASTRQVHAGPLLSGATLARAARLPTFAEHRAVGQLDGILRMHAEAVQTSRGRLIVVAGTSLSTRDESLGELSMLLWLGGAVALLTSSLAGFAVASGALGPVDAMRRRARTISLAESGQRLPVPRSGDEIARLGETLNDMLDRLDAAFARERAFAADASHELRTPLAILKAEVELALRRGRSAEELRLALESVGEETDRLARIANDLLVIARLDDGRLRVAPAPLDAGELLGGVVLRFAPRALRDGRIVDVAAPEGLSVLGDRAQLEQALGNLLDNALRHARREVGVSAEARDRSVAIHVCDDGDGFDPALIELAFERFVSGERDGSREGAGLGLAIVMAIARAHGGRVRATNRPQGGAQVTLEVPAGDAAGVKAPAFVAS